MKIMISSFGGNVLSREQMKKIDNSRLVNNESRADADAEKDR
jgi:hypothetical protein